MPGAERRQASTASWIARRRSGRPHGRTSSRVSPMPPRTTLPRSVAHAHSVTRRQDRPVDDVGGMQCHRDSTSIYARATGAAVSAPLAGDGPPSPTSASVRQLVVDGDLHAVFRRRWAMFRRVVARPRRAPAAPSLGSCRLPPVAPRDTGRTSRRRGLEALQRQCCLDHYS